MEFSRTEYWSGYSFLSPGESSQPRDQNQVSRALQADYLPAEPQGKPKNTEVGRLSLFFPSSGIEPGSPASQADSLPTELSGKPIVLFFFVFKLDPFPLTFVFFLPFLSITPECQSLTDLQLFFRFL